MNLTFESTDIPHEPDESEDVPTVVNTEGLCSVDKCDQPIKQYAGRGKRPTKCESHSGTSARGSGAASGKGRWQESLTTRLTSTGVMVGMIAGAFNRRDGEIIVAGMPAFAESLVAVAETDPKVRKALEALVTGGAWSQVAMAGSAIAIPIAQNHGWIPSPKPKPAAPKVVPFNG